MARTEQKTGGVTATSVRQDVLEVISTLSPAISSNLELEIPYPPMLDYLEMLLSWGERMDLISQRDPLVASRAHIVDCIVGGLVLGSATDIASFAHPVLDVGSGAGLPGVVLSIMFPKTPFILCEPRDKRVQFLKEVRRRLSLENVQIVHSRLSDLLNHLPDNRLQLVVSRALGMEAELVEEIRAQADPAFPPYFGWFVGADWVSPPSVANLSDYSYRIPGISSHRIVIAR